MTHLAVALVVNLLAVLPISPGFVAEKAILRTFRVHPLAYGHARNCRLLTREDLLEEIRHLGLLVLFVPVENSAWIASIGQLVAERRMAIPTRLAVGVWIRGSIEAERHQPLVVEATGAARRAPDEKSRNPLAH